MVSERVTPTADDLPGYEERIPDWGCEAKHHLVPVTPDTVLCQVPWDWLARDAETWHMDPGFPDQEDRQREGYFKAPMLNAPPEYDPHGVVVRVRCHWGPEDYWEQMPDPETGYEPPPHTFRDRPIWSVTPAFDAHNEPWWIITTGTPHQQEVEDDMA